MLANPVAVSLHALLALQAPSPAAASDQTILWFRAPDAATIDSRALLDAVTVYTRDLGLALRAVPEPTAVPSDAPSAAAAGAALRAQGARLGFWCEMRPGADLAVLTVVAPDGHLELHLVERTGAHEAELYRAIALKLRSVLVGSATPELAAPPIAPPPVPAAPPPSPAAADAALRAQAAPVGTPRRLFVSVGYRLSAPFDATPFRHALALDGAMTIGRLIEIDAGTELAARRQQQVTTAAVVNTVSLFDLPITAGARVVRRGARFSIGGGAFAALHLLWASASGSDGMEGSSFTLGGGAGAEILARLRLGGGLAGELRLYAEIPLPTTTYAVDGASAVEIGPRIGLGLGLAFPAP